MKFVVSGPAVMSGGGDARSNCELSPLAQPHSSRSSAPVVVTEGAVIEFAVTDPVVVVAAAPSLTAVTPDTTYTWMITSSPEWEGAVTVCAPPTVTGLVQTFRWV